MNLMPMFTTTTVMMLSAGASFAGGAIVPVVEAQPVMIDEVPVASNWAGAYVGGSLGYVFGADDEVGLQGIGDNGPIGRASGITDVDVSGLTASAHIGYRWQRDNWVFGPNLSIQGGSVDETSSGSFSLNDFDYDTEVKSEIKYLVDLTMKTGYLVNPATLVYGVAGVTRGEFNYEFDTTGTSSGARFTGFSSEDYSETGYIVGFGVERTISERLSAFGEYNYRDFGETTLTTPLAVGEGSTRATPSHSNVKFGVNYRF